MKNYNENMISLGDINYIIDLDKYSKLLSNDEDKMGTETETENKFVPDDTDSKNLYLIETSVITREFEKTQVIDGPKYDVLRMCLEVILTYNEEIDETLGIERALQSATIPFKLAFNTLLSFGILSEVKEAK